MKGWGSEGSPSPSPDCPMNGVEASSPPTVAHYCNSGKKDILSTPLPTLTEKLYIQSECRTLPTPHTLFFCSWTFPPPAPASKWTSSSLPELSALEVQLKRVGLWLGMCEEVGEVGEFYQSWLGIAVYHGAPAALVPPWEGSIQSISPIWRG